MLNTQPVNNLYYNVPVYKLQVEIDYFYNDFICYEDPQNGKVPSWKILRENESTHIMKKVKRDFCNTYGLDIEKCTAKYYILDSDTYLPPHIDYNTKCAANWILSGSEAPVSYDSGDYYYTNAILDTTKLHWVQNGNEPRVLFKISFFDVSYEDLVYVTCN